MKETEVSQLRAAVYLFQSRSIMSDGGDSAANGHNSHTFDSELGQKVNVSVVSHRGEKIMMSPMTRITNRSK